jgi:regulatory protein
VTSPPRSRGGYAPSCWGKPLPWWPRRKPKLKPERDEDTVQARATALDLLSRREHGEQELARKLAARGIGIGVVKTTVAALAAEGLLSDSRYVESFIHSRVERGQGPLKIRAELRTRGIDDVLIDACLDACAPHWQELLEQVRLKKFGTQRPDNIRERSRQTRFLLQRGFTAEQIDALFRGRD